jgi:hypothetical protein
MLMRVVKNIYLWCLVIILAGIVVHAPLSVGFGSLWPDYDLLIKSWKEVLMLVAGVMFLILMYRNKRQDLLRDPIVIAIAAYATLHVVSLLIFNNGPSPILSGLAIDLRYVLFFSLVYLFLKLYPSYKNLFIKIGVGGALIVAIFSLLQVFVLPVDFLKHIGYSIDTISPYLTVDQNYDFIRINGTMRGPNPLGAYAGMVLVFVMAAVLKSKLKEDKHLRVIAAVLLIGGVIALLFSYSRSAWIGTAIALLIVVLVVFGRKVFNKKLIAAGAILLLFGGIVAVVNPSFVSNVILHENPIDDNSLNSNDGHVNSLIQGLGLMAVQPLGKGIGSTGSASLYGDVPIIIENQYLFIAHEVGWLGLALFLYIFWLVMSRLWRIKKDWFALAVFASGISLAIIGLLLPVWADDTVSIIWWGLAAMALANKKIAT